jgi:plasmid stabilization system protein ParE
MGWKVIIAPSARADLETIVRFIARQSSDAATRVGYELIVRAEGLAGFPEMGRVVPEFKLPDLREVVCRTYRIIYRLKRHQQHIEIVRFWHGARGFPQIPEGA